MNARSHGWFLTSAVMLPVMPLLMTMVRPLNAAKPATTSSMVALSHVTLMRGACDCCASPACVAMYCWIDIGVLLMLGVNTRAGGARLPVTGGSAAGAGSGAAATLAAVSLDHPANAERSVPICTCTRPSPRWIW